MDSGSLPRCPSCASPAGTVHQAIGPCPQGVPGTVTGVQRPRLHRGGREVNSGLGDREAHPQSHTAHGCGLQWKQCERRALTKAPGILGCSLRTNPYLIPYQTVEPRAHQLINCRKQRARSLLQVKPLSAFDMEKTV